MKINVFEGARRIAILIAGVATIGTLSVLVTQDPYVSVSYSIANPLDDFKKIEGSSPKDANWHYFTTKTSNGKKVSVNLYLLPMEFENNKKLIPYKVDNKGWFWGAEGYSSDVSDYERELETRFKIPQIDEVQIEKEISNLYRKELIQGIGFLIGGLAIFGGVVWTIGWIVRGFLGIPMGMDRRPE